MFSYANTAATRPQLGRRSILVVGALLLGTCAALFYSSVPDDSAYWPAIGLGTSIASLAMIFWLRGLGFLWQSAPVAYLGFLWMFHFPMTLVLHLASGLQAGLPAPLSGWGQDSEWYRASLYAMLCVTAFALGAGLTPRTPLAQRRESLDPDIPKFHIGMLTAAAGLVWLYYQLIREGGMDLFGNSYAQLYTSLYSSSFSLAAFTIAVGCMIALLSAPRRLVWLPVLLQAAGSAPVLLTGARQFAMIGPLVLAVLAVKRGLRLGLFRTAITCALALWIVSYVGESRSHGVMEGVFDGRSVGPVNALVEMGGSLQTTGLAIDWIQNGDRYLTGGSYWLPIERGLGLLLPLRTDLATDPRAMNMIMVSRTSGLGGSAVAESYYNFSAFGCLFFLLLGYLLGRLEIGASSPVSAAFMGVVLYAFLFQARNWFISVPSLLFFGSLPVIACKLLEVVTRWRSAASRADVAEQWVAARHA